MKKLFVASLLLMLFFGVSSAQSSFERPSDYEPVLTRSEFFGAQKSEGSNFLVLRDQLPWGLDVTVPILLGKGATVTTATSTDFPGLDFADYCVVVIESSQSSDFYAAYTSNFSKFVDYVESGGVLQVHAATFTSPSVAEITLPGGTVPVGNPVSTNIVALPTHPIVAGVPSPFSGSSASHGYLDNLVPGAIIITEQSNNQPTTIEYTLGSGLVIATTVTYEFAYYHNWGAAEMLPNSLQYSSDFSPQPVPLSNWALFSGIFLIMLFTAFRFKRVV